MDTFLNTGAGPKAAANAVLAYLEHHDGVESSWNETTKAYDARLTIADWHNCREQGYVISSIHPEKTQLNIIVFEHRNSDSICMVKWNQSTLNPPTIDTAEFGDVYQTKYDVSESFAYNQPYEAAQWIHEEFEAFWT